MKQFKQPWLAAPFVDLTFIIGPAILPVIAVFLFSDYFASHEVSTIWWLVLVVGVDVSHVYSTIFRLYWDRNIFRKYRHLLTVIPLCGFIIGLALHYTDPMIFWRVLAYLAVFHFIRQQYGFMRLYSRKESSGSRERFVDTLAIYNATLYPIIYWHLNPTSKISWFVKGDFLTTSAPAVDNFSFLVYLFIIVVYVLKEIWQAFGTRRDFNIPKNLLIAGTYFSWYVGIVYFQADLVFTLLNVVAHGIPYMTLIWVFGQKSRNTREPFSWKQLPIFYFIIVGLAYLEENLWDSFIWRDHGNVFPLLAGLPTIDNHLLVSALVALFTLPQLTHYILDGFLWRFRSGKTAPAFA